MAKERTSVRPKDRPKVADQAHSQLPRCKCGKIMPKRDNHSLCIKCRDCGPLGCDVCRDWSPKRRDDVKKSQEVGALKAAQRQARKSSGASAASVSAGVSRPNSPASGKFSIDNVSEVRSVASLLEELEYLRRKVDKPVSTSELLPKSPDLPPSGPRPSSHLPSEGEKSRSPERWMVRREGQERGSVDGDGDADLPPRSVVRDRSRSVESRSQYRSSERQRSSRDRSAGSHSSRRRSRSRDRSPSRSRRSYEYDAREGRYDGGRNFYGRERSFPNHCGPWDFNYYDDRYFYPGRFPEYDYRYRRSRSPREHRSYGMGDGRRSGGEHSRTAEERKHSRMERRSRSRSPFQRDFASRSKSRSPPVVNDTLLMDSQSNKDKTKKDDDINDMLSVVVHDSERGDLLSESEREDTRNEDVTPDLSWQALVKEACAVLGPKICPPPIFSPEVEADGFDIDAYRANSGKPASVAPRLFPHPGKAVKSLLATSGFMRGDGAPLSLKDLKGSLPDSNPLWGTKVFSTTGLKAPRKSNFAVDSRFDFLPESVGSDPDSAYNLPSSVSTSWTDHQKSEGLFRVGFNATCYADFFVAAAETKLHEVQPLLTSDCRPAFDSACAFLEAQKDAMSSAWDFLSRGIANLLLAKRDAVLASSNLDKAAKTQLRTQPVTAKYLFNKYEAKARKLSDERRSRTPFFKFDSRSKPAFKPNHGRGKPFPFHNPKPVFPRGGYAARSNRGGKRGRGGKQAFFPPNSTKGAGPKTQP